MFHLVLVPVYINILMKLYNIVSIENRGWNMRCMH